jgi:hypothetical protein
VCAWCSTTQQAYVLIGQDSTMQYSTVPEAPAPVVIAGEEKDMGPPVFRGALTDTLSLSSLSEESKLPLRVFSAALPPREVPELMLPAFKKGSATCGAGKVRHISV